MVAHHVHQLLSILPNALAFGYTKLKPEPEEFKVSQRCTAPCMSVLICVYKNLDTDVTIDFAGDTLYQLFLSTLDHQSVGPNAILKDLCESWDGYQSCHIRPESQWVNNLSSYITGLVGTRIQHVESWVAQNVEIFQSAGQTSLTMLHHMFEATIIDIRGNNQLCRQQCSSCQLTCLLSS